MLTEDKYFACFISMSDLKTDARTLNVIRTLIKQGKKIIAIAYGKKECIKKYKDEGFDFYPLEEPSGVRAYKKWLKFVKECNKLPISAEIFWASDIYSLKPTINFKTKNHAFLYYDSREIYSAIGSLVNRKIAQKVQTYLELKWVKKVDKIIVSGELDKDYLEKHFKTNAPFYVIKNLPPFRQAIKTNLIREKYKIPDDAVIMLYQGMLSQGRGILAVLEAMEYLPHHYFVLMGSGVLKKYIEEYSFVNNIKRRVILAGIVDYDKLHEWTCSADIGISLIEGITLSYKLALPNKLFEYCMAGIPSVVSDLPAMKQIVNKYQIGIVIPDKISAEELANRIKQISTNEKMNFYKSNCINVAKELSYESQENVMNQIFTI